MDKNSYTYKSIAATVKKLKKSELVDHIARVVDKYDEAERALNRALKIERDKNKILAPRAEFYKVLYAAVELVVATRSGGNGITQEQLALLVEDAGGRTYAPKDNSPADIIDEILDNSETIIHDVAIAQDIERDRLQNALKIALADRARLLYRLGLTDREWSMMGTDNGSYTDIES